jgi:hypothetical protein
MTAYEIHAELFKNLRQKSSDRLGHLLAQGWTADTGNVLGHVNCFRGLSFSAFGVDLEYLEGRPACESQQAVGIGHQVVGQENAGHDIRAPHDNVAPHGLVIEP